MKPICHLGVSIITGVVTFLITKTISPSIACFLAGWLVDVDHIWDFYKNAGKGFNVKRFVNTFEKGEVKKAYLYLHSYELLFTLALLCFFIHFNHLLSFATLGFGIHLFFDQILNPVKPLSYFITYRILHDYNADRLFTHQIKEKTCG